MTAIFIPSSGKATGTYFAGDKTIDETVALIQNRVQLYVNENR